MKKLQEADGESGGSQSPKDKAKELVDKFIPQWFIRKAIRKASLKNEADVEHAKQCALICVDEILKEIHDNAFWIPSRTQIEREKFWQDVKNEIENL